MSKQITINILSSSIVAQNNKYVKNFNVSLEDNYNGIIQKALNGVPEEFKTGNEWLINPMKLEVRTEEEKQQFVDMDKLEGTVYLWLAMN